MNTFSVSSTVRKYPLLPYKKIKESVLGTAYDVSLVFVGEVRARSLNEAHRGATYIPNVLSFPLTDRAGEIYICPRRAEKEAKNFNMSVRGYVGYLFIHGLLHLKGYDHGDTMERVEQRLLRKYSLS